MNRSNWDSHAWQDADGEDAEAWESEDAEFEMTSSDKDFDPDDETEGCPFCGRQVYHDAEQCPYCRNYLLDRDTSATIHRPTWVVVTAMLLIAIILYWFIGPLL